MNSSEDESDGNSPRNCDINSISSNTSSKSTFEIEGTVAACINFVYCELFQ